MKKALVLVVVLCAASVSSAQTVTCAVSGLNAKQTALVAQFLADVNAHPPQGAPIPFATFAAYCSWNTKNEVLEFIAKMDAVNSAKVAEQASAHGDEVAPTAMCTAAGLAAGCTRNQVGCFVFTGNTACN